MTSGEIVLGLIVVCSIAAIIRILLLDHSEVHTTQMQPHDLLAKLLRDLHHIQERVVHMANELANLQAAATAVVAKISDLQTQLANVPPPGVDPAAVQAVANQLETAAGIPNTTAG